MLHGSKLIWQQQLRTPLAPAAMDCRSPTPAELQHRWFELLERNAITSWYWNNLFDHGVDVVFAGHVHNTSALACVHRNSTVTVMNGSNTNRPLRNARHQCTWYLGQLAMLKNTTTLQISGSPGMHGALYVRLFTFGSTQ